MIVFDVRERGVAVNFERPLRALHASPSLREGVLCITSLTTDSRSDHVRLTVARPLWIPAFAGMTEVMHSTQRRGSVIQVSGFVVPAAVVLDCAFHLQEALF